MKTLPELKGCDLVMQGGITSGIVYPGAVFELSSQYRFNYIGGASAGAIAAVGTAAAEFARQTGKKQDFSQLKDLMGELATTPGFVRNLFQPTEKAHPYFLILLAAAVGGNSVWSRLRWGAETLLRQPVVAGTAVGGLTWILGAILGWWRIFPGLSDYKSVVVGTTMVVFVFFVIGVLNLVWLVFRLMRILKQQTFGLCPGITQQGYRQPAVTDWLHQKVQELAGRTTKDPALTFADLAAHDIHLRMVSTDLSHGRPVVIPFDGSEKYYFTKADVSTWFPHAVVSQLIAGQTPREIGGLQLYEMPVMEMPVVVAARLSLGFPVLMSSIRLWSMRPEQGNDKPLEHLLSDGGISSNFPIHFFDEWLPRRPTFGLSLQDTDSNDVPNPEVSLSVEPWPPRWSGTPGVIEFFMQAFDASRNWRDRANAEMPASRDRVCQIFLAKGEGGLNLDMDKDVIGRLTKRGHLAGQEILRKFDFEKHQSRRYLTLMRALQKEVSAAAESQKVAPFQPSDGGFDGWVPSESDWRQSMLEATAALTKVAMQLGREGDVGAVFHPEMAEVPRPILRIVPDV
jgi:predicted acylesterase/phospholipase RssA